jgi:hypothetical protein
MDNEILMVRCQVIDFRSAIGQFRFGILSAHNFTENFSVAGGFIWNLNLQNNS